MKRLSMLLSSLLMITMLVSCATSKEARTYKKTINGNWQLQTVITEGITGKIKAQVFNEQDFNCFVGSAWSFNQNNSLGSYAISKNGGECVAVKRDIRWSIYEAAGEPKLLQFKRLDTKLKEIDENGGGFRFTIVQLDDSKMQLRNDVVFEGKTASFIYNFVRN
ncbi:MAG: Conserved hypothetical lipoprotein [Ferruginibacter sp.]|nr:Conserved hypothetical lipoprotein [Ferruginibacter sp.]